MFGIGFKSTPKVDLQGPMRAYLSVKYSKQEVDKHMDAVKQFQTMRNSVADINTANEGAAAALRYYFEQLTSAAEKFPVSETSVKIAFTWSDTLRCNNNVSQFNWNYERACVLFNIAAIDSQTAARIDRKAGPEAVEHVKSLFSSAAGALVLIRDTYSRHLLGTVPVDLTEEGLNLYINLLLAQVQSIYYELAQAKGMKPETTSKLAGSAADLYRAAAKSLPVGAGATGVKEQADEAFPWITHCEMWGCIFDGASFYQYSSKAHADAEAVGKGYGQRIAWMQATEAAANAAIAIHKAACTHDKKRSAKAVQAAAANLDISVAHSLLAAVKEKKADAEDDNKRIYLETVPRLTELPELPRHTLAKAVPFFEPTLEARAGASSVPIFACILPADVSRSLAGIDDRLSSIAAVAKDKATKASEEARAILSTMGLPASVSAGAGAAAGGLPQQMWERVHACQRVGGVAEIDRALASNASIAAIVRETLHHAAAVLDEEAGRDGACRAHCGPQWTALSSEIVSSDIRSDLSKYGRLLDMASASEGTVKGKVHARRQALAGLGRSKADIDASIPAGAPAAGEQASDPIAITLRAELLSLCAALDELLTARAALPGTVSARFDRTGAAAALTSIPSAQHAEMVDRLLSAPHPSLQALEAGYAQQESLLSSISATYERYGQVRSLDERTRARESAIQAVSQAVDAFDECLSNIKEGETFWTELHGRAQGVLTRARDLCAARAMQQRELLMNLQAAQGQGGDAGLSFGSISSPAYPPAMPVMSTVPQQQMHAVPVSLPPISIARGEQASARVASSPYGATPGPSGSPSFAAAFPAPTYSIGGLGGGHADSVPVAQPVPSMYVPSGYAYGAQQGTGYAQPAQQQQYAGAGAGQHAYSPIPQSTTPTVTVVPQGVDPQQTNASQLMSMGFDAAKVEWALAANGGDFNRALNQLLTQG